MSNKIKALLKIISNVIVTLALLLVVLLIGFRLIGFQMYTVLSGSMEPTHKVGSVVYVRKVKEEKLKKDDVITYHLDKKTLSTHRIVEIVKDKETQEIKYRTKGDANEDEDAVLVEYKDIKGKVIFSIPLLGYILTFINTPAGKIIATSIFVMLISFVIIIELITEDDKSNSKRRKKNEKESSNNSK